MPVNQLNIRNFAIVAHIDHGKSTLADRLLENTGTIEKRKMMEQILDSNPIERERGITIKLAPVRMLYRFEGQEYILNLIDTPGHVDFSYEVSRSLAACEGVILIVDATQGIQAQTVAHMNLIRNRRLKVIPVVNKIDLASAKIGETRKALNTMYGFPEDDIIEISAKKNINIDQVLVSIIKEIPPPKFDEFAPFKALVFSSQYDIHKGVVIYIRVIDGYIDIDNFTKVQGKNASDKLMFLASKADFSPLELGFFHPDMKPSDQLKAGDVGYIATGLKDLSLARVGDTLTVKGYEINPLEGYQEPKPMVYLCFYPTDNDDFQILRESMEKLHLSDSSFTFKLHSSASLGKGFLCGFLGLLHADVVRERLQNEFDLTIITTSPTVEYELHLRNKTIEFIHTPEQFPDPSFIELVREPVMYTTIYSPKENIGSVMQLCEDKRAVFINMEYIGMAVQLTYIIPLSEMIVDFFDKLKSITSGYASLDYEFYEYREANVVKLDILLNKKIVDAFSQIIVRDNSLKTAQKIVERLKDMIPRHQFRIPIQAAIGGTIIARSDVRSFRKDVTQKLYGGDRTRKDKLLEAQKKGKKRMRQFGEVNIPQEVFLNINKSR